MFFDHGAQFNAPINFDYSIWSLILHFRCVLIKVHALRQLRQPVYQLWDFWNLLDWTTSPATSSRSVAGHNHLFLFHAIHEYMIRIDNTLTI